MQSLELSMHNPYESFIGNTKVLQRLFRRMYYYQYTEGNAYLCDGTGILVGARMKNL